MRKKRTRRIKESRITIGIFGMLMIFLITSLFLKGIRIYKDYDVDFISELNEFEAKKAKKDSVYVYNAYNFEDGKVIDESTVTTYHHLSGRKVVHWDEVHDGFTNDELYFLDDDYATEAWKIKLPKQKTEYVAQRAGNKLQLEGTFKGKEFDKVLQIDQHRFIYNPKIGLSKFTMSDKDYMKFWSLRIDKLTAHQMEAFKKGNETINFQGKPVEVVKVYWAAKGIGEKFFNRTYYFRKSDGVFLKQDPVDDWSIKLIKEE